MTNADALQRAQDLSTAFRKTMTEDAHQNKPSPLSRLKAAASAGVDVREALSQTSKFAFTKWFDCLQSGVKPAILAIAVASGTTGCATMTNNAQTNQASVYESMVAEAASLKELPRNELMERIADRPQSSRFDSLPTITVKELAESTANNAERRPPLESAKAIDSPFTPGKRVRVSLNSDWGANFDMGIKDGLGWSYLISTPGIDNPHAINANINTQGKVASFQDPSLPSYIILPEKMLHTTWGFGTKASFKERYGFVIFHELAHLHLTQELALHGDDVIHDSLADAHHKSYKMFNEAHADVTAGIATFKAYNLSTEDFLARVKSLIQMQNHVIRESGLNGSPETNTGLSMYRASRAFEVLAEIAERDPQFLKSLTYEAMPVVAYDIVKKAGYYHNAAELILAEQSEKWPEISASPDAIRDLKLRQLIESHLPMTPELTQALDDLTNTSKHRLLRSELESFNSTLTSARIFPDMGIPERSVERLLATADYEIYPRADLAEWVNEHTSNVRSSADPRTLGENLNRLQQKIEDELANLPDDTEVMQQRAKAMLDLEHALAKLSRDAMTKDASSVIAQGSGEGPEMIASDILSTYRASYALEQAGEPANLGTSLASHLADFDHETPYSGPTL